MGDNLSSPIHPTNFSRNFSYGELSELKDRLGILPGEKTIISVSRLTQKNGVSR